MGESNAMFGINSNAHDAKKFWNFGKCGIVNDVCRVQRAHIRLIGYNKTNTLTIMKQEFKCSTQIHFRCAMTERRGGKLLTNYIV